VWFEAAGEFGGTHLLTDHLVQQKDLGGDAGGQFHQVLAALCG
jgi:hypothetical protein